MPVLVRLKKILLSEWRQAGVVGRFVYLYYFIFFVIEIYYVMHLDQVIMGSN